MFADPKLVERRRRKRRLKAAASVLVALAAGTFLACQRQLEKLSGTTEAPSPGVSEASGDAPTDASRGAPEDAPRGAPDAAVDVKEHRKGMPVPDNLLE
jgi:hypothetical protein